MENRIQIDQIDPKSFKGLLTLEQHLNDCSMNKTHVELIKIRASQVNGCAFCLDMHSKDAIVNGESAQRLFVLNGWRDTNFFSEEEQIILMVTEEVTLIHNGGLSTETYNKALSILGEKYLAQVIMSVVAINAWNRIAISTHKPITE
ncbi:carboxymuconolactone decarboxylase family protein [Roseivirga spongicola]|uniref:carboxymuconolactone decarboxylase family protein n=1 Tax=Roseivirga spongicola TaxID=333140 RepID=UPI002AC8AB20|nr:carboxymuconolactone decarboxylase family protein [Roseivirga spongicola]WPZ12217.1 carboxymuconolactone decarboxylase family protein [Roseivirga spongicola]